MTMWDRILRRNAPLEPSSVAAQLADDRPTFVVDFKDMRVVPTNDLTKLRDENAWSSPTWGYRVFGPKEVFHDEISAWKAVRLSILTRRKELRRQWQAVMHNVWVFRQHRKQFKPVLPYPDRFYLFDQTNGEIITVYTDQMVPVKEYIGDIREYDVNIAGTFIGRFPKTRFYGDFVRCAAESAGTYYGITLDLLRDNLREINNYLYGADWQYRVETSYGTLYARNRKQLRKQLIRAVESGWLVKAVYDAAEGPNPTKRLTIGWKPIILPQVVGKVVVI